VEELALLLKEKLAGVDAEGFMVEGREGGGRRRRDERLGWRAAGKEDPVSSDSFRYRWWQMWFLYVL